MIFGDTGPLCVDEVFYEQNDLQALQEAIGQVQLRDRQLPLVFIAQVAAILVMNVLDLFSGIGGFSLGLERAGMRTVAFCERDEYCRAVLRKHWPGVPCFDDIHAIDADGLGRLGRIDLVCGGFPCQPFSVAGKQRAHADDRHLWPQMRRVIALARPTWVIGENVAGIIALALDDVLADLEADGYTPRAFVIPACAVDARHRRDRVWIIARDANEHSKSVGAINAEVEELRRIDADTNGHEHEGSSSQNWRQGAAELSLADATSLQRRAIERDESDRALSGNGASTDTDSDSVWQQSEPVSRRGSAPESRADREAIPNAASGRWRERPTIAGGRSEGAGANERSGSAGSCRWKPEPDVGRVAHGVPRRVDRLRTLGNAVVPQVVEEIGRAIMLSY